MNILAPKKLEDKSTQRPVLIALPSDWPSLPAHPARDRMLFWLALVRMFLETIIRLATISADSKPLRLLILVVGVVLVALIEKDGDPLLIGVIGLVLIVLSVVAAGVPEEVKNILGRCLGRWGRSCALDTLRAFLSGERYRDHKKRPGYGFSCRRPLLSSCFDRGKRPRGIDQTIKKEPHEFKRVGFRCTLD